MNTNPKTNYHRHFQQSLQVCDGCEHKCGSCQTGCNLMTPPGLLGGELLQGNPCPEGRFSAGWGREKGTTVMPSDCTVVTGTDQRFVRGAYFLAWTLLRSNSVRMMCYADRVPPDDPHRTQMESWGVVFRDMPLTIADRDTAAYQTWNKPAIVADVMGCDGGRIAWLDADTSVGGSLADMFEAIRKTPFAPNHGLFIPNNHNGKRIRQLFGPQAREFAPDEWPCAGVLGFDASRDAELVTKWAARCRRVVVHPELWRKCKTSQLRFYDQGVLQDLWQWDTHEGLRWNNLQVLRAGTIPQLMHQTFGYPKTTICHYGGKDKPWFGWPEMLNWGDPRR